MHNLVRSYLISYYIYENFKCTFSPFLGTKLEIHVSAEEYVSKDLNCLKFVVVVKVLETGKQYVDDCKFQLYNKDCIKVDVSKNKKHK